MIYDSEKMLPHTGKEVIIFTCTINNADLCNNFVNSLHRVNLYNYLLLSMHEDECIKLRNVWPFDNFKCLWSSYMNENRDYDRWGLSKDHIYRLWNYKWRISRQLLEHSINVLSVDVDGIFLTNIYTQLKRSVFREYDVIITDVNEKNGVNCGFLYFNDERKKALKVASAIEQRIELFVKGNIVKENNKIRPDIFWDAHVWNDVLLSFQNGNSVHPWAWGKTRHASIWKEFNYTRYAYREKFIIHEHAGKIESNIEIPNISNGYKYYKYNRNKPVQKMKSKDINILFSPLWLVCQGSSPCIEWALIDPPQSSYIHMVNMWRCFGADYCYARPTRKWWLQMSHLWYDTKPIKMRKVIYARYPDKCLNMRELHVFLNNFMRIAANLRAVPVLPKMPCSCYQNYKHSKWSMHNIGIPDIMVLNKKDCVVYPGGEDCAPNILYESQNINSSFSESINVPYDHIINVSRSSILIRKCSKYIAKGVQYDRSKRIDAKKIMSISS